MKRWKNMCLTQGSNHNWKGDKSIPPSCWLGLKWGIIWFFMSSISREIDQNTFYARCGILRFCNKKIVKWGHVIFGQFSVIAANNKRDSIAFFKNWTTRKERGIPTTISRIVEYLKKVFTISLQDLIWWFNY